MADTGTLLTKAAIAARADSLLPTFRKMISDIPPEAGFGGFWESEMFLFFATVTPCAPSQILESGRARGRSTSILARCVPQSGIVSVEPERDSENAPAAEAKLKAFNNVE